MIPRQNGWSERDLYMFIRGYITSQAQEARDEGLFLDLTLDETVELMVNDYIKQLEHQNKGV